MSILSVNDIIAQLSRSQMVKPHLYEVRIVGASTQEDATQEIMMNCSAINVPGRNIQYAPHKKHTIGHPYNLPVGKTFTELNMTFYETDREEELQYFTSWQDKIYNLDTRRFNFFDDYTKTISIIQYDNRGKVAYEAQLLEAFPSNISPLDRSYSAINAIAQFTVNFQYHEIREIYVGKSVAKRPIPLRPIT